MRLLRKNQNSLVANDFYFTYFFTLSSLGSGIRRLARYSNSSLSVFGLPEVTILGFLVTKPKGFPILLPSFFLSLSRSDAKYSSDSFSEGRYLFKLSLHSFLSKSCYFLIALLYTHRLIYNIDLTIRHYIADYIIIQVYTKKLLVLHTKHSEFLSSILILKSSSISYHFNMQRLNSSNTPFLSSLKTLFYIAKSPEHIIILRAFLFRF